MKEIKLDGNGSSSDDDASFSDSARSPREEKEPQSDSEGDSDDAANEKLTEDDDAKKAIDAEIKHAIALASEAASKTFGWDKKRDNKASVKNGTINGKPNKKKPGNELTQLIPGYTAPMRLEAPSLKGKSARSIHQLRKESVKKDASLVKSSISVPKNDAGLFDATALAKKVKTPSSIAIQKAKGGMAVGKIPTSFSSSFRKTSQKQHDPTAGSGWFGMTPTPMTDQLKTDLAMIRNRNYLDPKKFYKSADSFDGKVLQVGTVIEGNSEYYSSRLTRKERRQNLTEEIMASKEISGYAKRKFRDLQMEKEQRRGGNKRPTKKGRKRR